MKKLLMLLVVVCVLSSCKTKSLFTRMNEGRQEAIAWCNLNVPIVVKQGETKIVTDTVTEQGDTIRVKVPCPDGSNVNVDCPPSKTRTVTKTVTKRDTIIDARGAENERLLRLKSDEENARLKGELDVAKQETVKEKEKSSTRLKWIIGLGIALAGSLYFNLRKVLPI